ncbi:hypothetical protein CHU_0781 [Sporocytophaga myxococcoides]|uniref:Uncharacterized protein n=1 Tax=Sporocytophaga myxococcoides TaxID=153721 RepID=A0A098LE33_9BACT|nr:hypothetical protein [Sporocytophaga myxococcoides]GAL84383.1 hypothetical protein CHU_0781 [Sporocytophaga myxococcoides]
MKREGSTYSQIEDYIHGRLTTEELLAFETELSNDSDLAKRVKLHKLADDLIIENRLLEVSALIKSQSGNSSSVKIKYTAISIFAATLVGFAGWFCFQNYSKKPSHNRYQAYQETIPEIKEAIPSKPFNDKNTPTVQKNKVKTKSNQAEISESVTPGNKVDSLPIFQMELTETEEKKSVISIISDKNNAVEKLSLNPCEKTELRASVKTIETCEGEEQGAIKVQQINGGTEPYTYTVFDGEEIKDATSLPSGSYKLIISDGNGCKKIFDNLIVKNKNCPKDYSFNPYIDENWEIPSMGKAGKLLIYDASGNIYFEKQVAEGDKEHWSGEGKSGEIKPGYYIFVFDRGKGGLVQGSVTIVK